MSDVERELIELCRHARAAATPEGFDEKGSGRLVTHPTERRDGGIDDVLVGIRERDLEEREHSGPPSPREDAERRYSTPLCYLARVTGRRAEEPGNAPDCRMSRKCLGEVGWCCRVGCNTLDRPPRKPAQDAVELVAVGASCLEAALDQASRRAHETQAHVVDRPRHDHEERHPEPG